MPDRVFFACGACHIPAAAWLERFGTGAAQPLAILPAPGFTHGHAVAATEAWVFGCHGYAEREGYFAHSFAKARRWWPGWDAMVVPVPPRAPTSGAASRESPGLRLREPRDFLHDALPRARASLDRFAHPPAAPPARMAERSLTPVTPLTPARPIQAVLDAHPGPLTGAPWRDIHDPVVRERHG